MSLLLQALLVFSVEAPTAVRFGVPLPERELARGLRLEGPGAAQLQWRRLQPQPDPVTGRTWVEIAVQGASGRMRIHAGGQPAGGGLLRLGSDEEETESARVRVRTWQWQDGRVDQLARTTFTALAALQDGEEFAPGESLSDASPELDRRWLGVRIARVFWQEAMVLPRDLGHGRTLRDELRRYALLLPEAPGRRGRGDHVRSRQTVTNHEFDTVLGLARLGLYCGDERLLAQALAAARHLVDIDLDARSGLPFRHGPDHRVSPPEHGHAWLSGLLLVGCLAADDELIAAAGGIAAALTRRLGSGEGRHERLRDFGWPLHELESWLRFAPDRAAARMASRLAAECVRRFDRAARCVRFGEGERAHGLYLDRCWLSGGVLLPGLRAHAQRSGDPGVWGVCAQLEAGLLARVASGRDGLPLRALVAGPTTIDELRVSAAPEACMLLDGMPATALARVLQRTQVRRALAGMLREDDPDLATSWSMIARCEWVYR